MKEEPKDTALAQNVVSILKTLRDLEGQYTIISYRAGTNGERGLYGKRKSVLSKINKARDEFRRTISDYELVYSHSWPNWFVKKK